MPSLLSRLRKRRTSTISHPHREGMTSPTTPTALPPHPPALLLLPQVDRKILSNPDSFLASFTDEADEISPISPTSSKSTPTITSAVVALKPSTRKGSGSGSGSDATRKPSGDTASGGGGGSPIKDSGSPPLIVSPSPGEWSTFGRQRERVSRTLLEEFGRMGDRDDDLDRSTGATSTPKRVPPEQGREGRTSSDRTSSKHKTPKTPSQLRSTSRSKSKSRSRSRSTNSHSFLTTSPSHTSDLTHSPEPEHTQESPQTFGHPTPPSITESRSTPTGYGYRFGFGFGFPLKFAFERGGTSPPPPRPPPMPALDHPALKGNTNPRRSRSRSSGSSSLHSTSPPARRLSTEEKQSTYPPHRRSSRTMGSWGGGGGGGTTSWTSSLPHTFGKPTRATSSNRPQAQQIFTRRSPSSSSDKTRNRSRSRSRSRRPSTGSNNKKKAERRTSAEWNAQQATEETGSWPALVSKEILRLSSMRPGPNSDIESAVASESGCEPGINRPRVDNVPLHRGGGHASLIPAQSPSSSLLLPVSFQGNDVDRNLSGLQADQHHARFLPNEVEGEEEVGSSMPVVKETSTTTEKTDSRSSPSPPSLPIPPFLSIISPTPETSPSAPTLIPSDPKSPSSTSTPSSSALRIPTMMKTPPNIPRTPSDKSKGKRKADESDITPPDQKKEAQHTTFAPVEIRPLRVSESSHAPSSYQNKRARITSPPPNTPQPKEGSSTLQQVANFGSWSSRASSRASPKNNRTPSRAASSRSAPAPHRDQNQQHNHQLHRASSDRRSISQMSIPISALVSPHAPSISRSSKFHMQDPRKPPRKRDTGWALRFGGGGQEEVGSPVQAWFFFLGFVVFPLWWAAAVMRTPKTRRVGGSDTEKAVMLDDPQVEHDAKVWRFRCRIMSAISLLTYIPFIVLIAIFAP